MNNTSLGRAVAAVMLVTSATTVVTPATTAVMPASPPQIRPAAPHRTLGRLGSSMAAERAPAVGIAGTTSGNGYWVVGRDGGVFTSGDAKFFGSTGAIRLNQPIVGMAATSSSAGYWLVAADGGIFSFGDANFQGSTGAIRLNQPIVGMAATPSGNGYWLVARDGGIFAFGDASFYGSTGNIRLAQPIVGMSRTPSGQGYWFVAADGGIFSFGNAQFRGSMGGVSLPSPIVGMGASTSGAGYWVVGGDGAVYRFGDAGSYGSGAGQLPPPVVGMAAHPGGNGYWLVDEAGNVISLPGGYSAAAGGSYTFLATNSDGTPIRYNPCEPVHYVTNLSEAPSTAAADLAGALTRVTGATGIDFVNDGTTTEIPTSQRSSYQPARYGDRWVPVLVAWATPTESDLLSGDNGLAVGGSTRVSNGTQSVYVTGEVTVNVGTTAAVQPGFGAGTTMGELLMHELGHVVGLGHTQDSNQIMYPVLEPRSAAVYGSGDVTGLVRVGRSEGCLDVPPPQGSASGATSLLPVTHNGSRLASFGN